MTFPVFLIINSGFNVSFLNCVTFQLKLIGETLWIKYAATTNEAFGVNNWNQESYNSKRPARETIQLAPRVL